MLKTARQQILCRLVIKEGYGLFLAYQSCERTSATVDTSVQQNQPFPFYDIEGIVTIMFLSLQRDTLFL